MVSEQETALRLPVLGGLTYREIHAVEDGFYCGVHDITESEYEQEKHYWRVAWLVGDYYDREFR
jgi:hypothetical protein